MKKGVRYEIDRVMDNKQKSAIRELRVASDENVRGQIEACASEALDLLPNRIEPNRMDVNVHPGMVWCGITIRVLCDYDWMVENCENLTFYYSDFNSTWEAAGSITHMAYGVWARLDIHGKAPDSDIQLLRRMGFIKISPARTYGGEPTFSCNMEG